MEFKIGDRVEVFDLRTQNLNPGDKGTIISGIDKYDCYFVDWDKSSLATRQIHSTWLRLINDKTKLMNDTDKIELTVADVKAAHAKGCSSVKQTLETMYPKVFDEKHSVGHRYKNDVGKTFILVGLYDNNVALIQESDGIAWDRPISVNDVYSITEDEFKKIGGKIRKYTKI